MNSKKLLLFIRDPVYIYRSGNTITLYNKKQVRKGKIEKHVHSSFSYKQAIHQTYYRRDYELPNGNRPLDHPENDPVSPWLVDKTILYLYPLHRVTVDERLLFP